MKGSKQTIFIKEADTLDPFEWAGKCAALSGITEEIGDVGYGVSPEPDPREMQTIRPDSAAEEVPTVVEAELSVTKSTRNLIATRMLRCRWHVDSRLQRRGLPSDPFGWITIDRLCRAKLTEYSTDLEVARSSDDDGRIIVASPVKARPPLHRFWRVEGYRVLDTFLEESEVALTALAVCHGEMCEGACRVIVGTETDGGVYEDCPYLGISDDGGQTWAWHAFDGTDYYPDWDTNIVSLDCVGDFILVCGHDGRYAISQDGAVTWTEFDLGMGIRACVVHSPSAFWISTWDGVAGRIHRGYDPDVLASAMPYDGGATAVIPSSAYARTLSVLHDKFVVAGLSDDDLLVFRDEQWEFITGPFPVWGGVNALALRNEDIWCVVLDSGLVGWTDDGGQTWTVDPIFPYVETPTDWPYLVILAGCERYILVGLHVEGEELEIRAWENVSGSPGMWEIIPTHVGGDAIVPLFAIQGLDWCAENVFIVAVYDFDTGVDSFVRFI